MKHCVAGQHIPTRHGTACYLVQSSGLLTIDVSVAAVVVVMLTDDQPHSILFE